MMNEVTSIETEHEPDAEDLSPLPDDRIGAFSSYSLAADLLKLHEIYAGYIERIPPDAWIRRTERRAAGWTLLETLAHLDAIATIFNLSIEQALAHQPIQIAGFTTRHDLRALNRKAIDERMMLGYNVLSESFLDSLRYTARLASALSYSQLATTVEHPYFSGRPTIAELVGTSLVHAGMVHGSQLAVGTRMQPIWNFYDPGMMRRQLTRAFHMVGLAYWPERGGTLHATLVFQIDGQGGGRWFVRIDPSGGEGRLGTVRTADVTLTFASADLLCRVVTMQTEIWPLFLLRKLHIRGNPILATRMSRLFILT
ncbi:SCP2 sterol-binding domain-containing protein [Candidatus Oscillochloris fontis]|uniref:SCP2 sterol-binding domain-containing protein n=1 Tax=Candidatus Oscillochloris fontis TaxID=2496868 RepID=UPI00101DFD29|nr:SCP2 sterol-binding domain-containing protein [Candidatus Oscillochloris fontis]